MRAYFFGAAASTRWNWNRLQEELSGYVHIDADSESSKDRRRIPNLWSDIRLVVHAAAQPSHDWAIKEPRTDFAVNAVGTQSPRSHTGAFPRRRFHFYQHE